MPLAEEAQASWGSSRRSSSSNSSSGSRSSSSNSSSSGGVVVLLAGVWMKSRPLPAGGGSTRVRPVPFCVRRALGGVWRIPVAAQGAGGHVFLLGARFLFPSRLLLKERVAIHFFFWAPRFLIP